MVIPFSPPVMSTQSLGELAVNVQTDPLLGNFTGIEGATVRIRSTNNTGDSTLIAEMTTNNAGLTPTIELPAPPKELSLDPLNELQPFSTFTVEVESPSFVPVRIEGSQIFDSIRSIQPVRLVPIPPLTAATRSTRQATIEITVPPPTLFGDFPPKIPEPEMKDVDVPGFIVLDAVVVPEIIIVHAGLPTNDAAPNYTVPYRDYVKNVASSEIYPTWDTQAIRANVTAIISFTLNRVYTEWYRNQGKFFTITNSTAFDQAFSFGRDIFNSISLVVDEIFDTYIRRPNAVQPLLAQYCDGLRSQCPGWLTQWGSQNLAQGGSSSDQILRNFYGANIVFPTAPQVTGIPESFPGSPIQRGDSGPSVRTIQQQLNRISDNFPLIPKMATDGIFGPSTENSVTVFQSVFNLPQTGIVDRATWYKISEIYVAVTRIAQL
jgi:hypothetical protein